MDVIVTNMARDGEVREFAAHGRAMLADAGGVALMKGIFEPGWRWSTDVAPLAGSAICQTRHLGLMLSGTMRVQMADGTEVDITEGDAFDIPAGHDAWVIGDVTCEMIDTSAAATRYASKVGPVQDDQAMAAVRRGYAAFNTGDIDTLRTIMTADVVQHVPGNGQFAGTYKGFDAVIGYYGKLAELTDGSFRASLVDVHGDGQGHVTAVHMMSATRNGQRRVSRGSILFTFLGDKATDLLELHGDLAGDDEFFG
jgi:ketosteroid isomerase-like protein